MELSAQDISGLKITPLGGLGEIGLNMVLFEYGDDLIIDDCGLMFPEPHARHRHRHSRHLLPAAPQGVPY